MILFLKPYAFQSSIRFLINAYFVVSTTSNKPRITCFGFQSDPKNIMTKIYTSCAPLDIHKSKLAITQLQSFSTCKTYVYLVFLPIHAKLCLKIICEKGIEHKDIIVTQNTLTTQSPQIAKASDFSQLKV